MREVRSPRSLLAVLAVALPALVFSSACDRPDVRDALDHLHTGGGGDHARRDGGGDHAHRDGGRPHADAGAGSCAAVLCPTGSNCFEGVCEPIVTDPCAAVRCAAGTHCEAQPGGAGARCVSDVAEVACGGIAARPCPGAGRCVDDPRDTCDPRNGGADCGGICRCDALGKCAAGFVWDRSPTVCGCVPAGGNRCGDATCPAGQVCCNATCGICTPPGGVCIQIACESK